jgi:hypothetical protein
VDEGEKMNKFHRILLLAFLIRLALTPFFSDDFNFWSVRFFVNLLMKGFNPWTVIYHDPTMYWINPWRYPPFIALFVLPASLIYFYTNDPLIFLYAIKIPIILSSLITSFLIYKIVCLLANDDGSAVKLASLYALNPFVIFLDMTNWGVLDAVAVMFTVASLYYFLVFHKNRNNGNLMLSAILLGCGIAAKLYPIFILPAFLAKLKRYKVILNFIIHTAIPFFIFSAPFLLWDYKAYIDILVFHNVGGYHPLFPFLHPSIQSLFDKIAILLPSVVFFIVAYTTKTPIVVNIILSLLALYFIMGGNIGSYSLWIVPFGLLLLTSKNIIMQRVGWVISVLPLPYIIIGLLVNGPYNSVEGTTGIFYFTYHYLRKKIVILKALESIKDVGAILAAISPALILFLFIFLVRESKNAFSNGVLIGGQADPRGFSRCDKGRGSISHQEVIKYIVLVIVILITHKLTFTYVFNMEFSEGMPLIAPSRFEFFDDFSSSLLNYQWSYGGEGYYVIKNKENPSYVLINSTGTPYNRAAIYRGWGPIWQGFPPSTYSKIEIRFKFSGLLPNAHGLIIARANGGWFGVAKNGNSTFFVYFDDINNLSTLLSLADYEWHNFSIIYDSGARLIYFDGKFVKRLEGKEFFSFLFIGNPDTTAGLGGSCMYDWVKVTIEDFPVKDQNKVVVAMALLLPLTVLLLIITFCIRYRYILILKTVLTSFT